MMGFLGTAIYFFAIYGLTSSEMIDLDTIQRRHIHNTRPIAYVTVNVEFQCDAMYVLEEEIGAPSHVKKEIAYIPLKAKKSLWGKTFLVATTYSGSFECVD